MTMRFIHDNLYPLFAALSIIAAIICGLGAPEPAQPRAFPQTAEPWNLPKAVEHDSKQSIDAINAHNFWGTIKVEAAKEPEWHISGIARSGAEQFILVAKEGGPTEILKVGDALPDGAKIVKIEDDRVFVITPDKKKITLGINKHDQAK